MLENGLEARVEMRPFEGNCATDVSPQLSVLHSRCRVLFSQALRKCV